MVNIFTIVLDGQPFISRHLSTFEKLKGPWKWVICEGASMNSRCTSWCKPQAPRLSKDGTTEYLNSIKNHPNVDVIQRESWDGKLEMVNEALSQFTEEGCCLEVDCDEFWTSDQIEIIVSTFESLKYVSEMQFYCRYFVGPNLIVKGDGYGNKSGEWIRAWRFVPGMQATSHEPPRMPQCGLKMGRESTSALGLVFDHLSYVTEAQVAAKELFYGYSGAVEKWKALQKVEHTPVRLKDYLDWSDDTVQAVRI